MNDEVMIPILITNDRLVAVAMHTCHGGHGRGGWREVRTTAGTDRGDDNNDDSDDDLAQASIAEFINMVWWLASIWI